MYVFGACISVKIVDVNYYLIGGGYRVSRPFASSYEDLFHKIVQNV